jgi:subtilisin-like proprotein convertase family protein
VTSTLLPTFTPIPAIPITYSPPLSINIFNPSLKGIYEPASFVDNISKTDYGVIFSEKTVEEEVFVDSTQGRVVFSLFWEEGDLDFTLIQPDGKLIDSSMAKLTQYFDYWTSDPISYMSNSGRAKYYLLVPPTGTWTMRIFGKSAAATGSNYILQVTSMAATSIYRIDEKEEYFSGDPITLSFGITDGVSGTLLAGREYIHGVTMMVTIEDPAKNQYSLELYDDGLHGDGEPDDGVYANIFSDTSLVGEYNFYLQIAGKNNRAKEPFTREYFFSIDVK